MGNQIEHNISRTPVNDTGNSLYAMMHMRGGTGVIYGNSVSGSRVSYGIWWDEYRVSSSCGGSTTFTVPGYGTVRASSSCASTEGYPCAQQVGRGQDNVADPVYIWDNDGLPATLYASGVSSYVAEGRDFHTGAPKPGYRAYPYPHPLVVGSVPVGRPTAPTDLRVY